MAKCFSITFVIILGTEITWIPEGPVRGGKGNRHMEEIGETFVWENTG